MREAPAPPQIEIKAVTKNITKSLPGLLCFRMIARPQPATGRIAATRTPGFFTRQTRTQVGPSSRSTRTRRVWAAILHLLRCGRIAVRDPNTAAAYRT